MIQVQPVGLPIGIVSGLYETKSGLITVVPMTWTQIVPPNSSRYHVSIGNIDPGRCFLIPSNSQPSAGEQGLFGDGYLQLQQPWNLLPSAVQSAWWGYLDAGGRFWYMEEIFKG